MNCSDNSSTTFASLYSTSFTSNHSSAILLGSFDSNTEGSPTTVTTNKYYKLEIVFSFFASVRILAAEFHLMFAATFLRL